MKNYFSINIIGYGYVGGALGYLCSKNKISFNVCDKIKKENEIYEYYTDNIKELIVNSELQNSKVNVYFIAVPTPSDMDGNCDTKIIDEVLEELSNNITKKSIVIIKSTMVPGSCDKFSDKYDNLDIVLCPEFLRESTFQEDMYNAKFVLVGTKNESLKEEIVLLFKMMYLNNPYIEFYFKSYKECEIFKYTLNVQLALKVWYFNEINEMCQKLNVNYNNVKELFVLDNRIGNYGTEVPGPDGQYGFGKKCLPKETRGLMRLLESLDMDTYKIFEHILKRNYHFRGAHE